MENVGLILGIYTVRILAVFAFFWILFEDFFEYKKKKWENTNIIWIVFYVLIMYAYRFVIMYGSRFWFWPMMILYWVKIIPFMCAKYGIKAKVIFAIPFYAFFTECIAENIMLVFMLNNITTSQAYPSMDADVFAACTEVLLFILLLVLALLKRENVIRIRFIELTPAEYIILSITCTVYGILEAGVYRQPKEISYAMKCLFIFGFAVFLVLVVHVITVRKQNSTMNATIGNLKEPMKQITESYIEMNEKNTELRKFRHDTKNLLLALGTLIKEGKYDQASEYIDRMQESIDAGKAKMFETGNFIADALLESKAKTASRLGINMSVEGIIPESKVEDVDLVILVSNLLDNAIEAAVQAIDKKIEIKSILKENIWILTVKNSCDKEVVIKDNRIETTKEDKESHGFGLLNIESITRKYDGKLELSWEKQEFIARAILTFDT